MIIPGTNIPIELTFDNNMEGYKKIVATLYIANKRVKTWNREDMTVQGTTLSLPLEEDETRKYKKGKAKLLIKGLNILDQIVFWDEATIQVIDRDDKDIDLIV